MNHKLFNEAWTVSDGVFLVFTTLLYSSSDYKMIYDDRIIVNLIIPNFEGVMSMIEKNIFRPLPNVKKIEDIDAEG